ncbi:MAG: hypothetical protein H6828_10335 [Planctomycetes bacterium]|nr:hypothetical protein [Planctomycetota bacterium]
MLRASLALLLVGALASARPQAELRTYELGALRRATCYEPQLDREGYQLQSADVDNCDWPELEPEPLDVLYDLFSEVAALPGVELSFVHGDRLVVRASAQAHANVARRIGYLEAELLRTIEVDAWQLASDALPDDVPARLTPAEVDALLSTTRTLRHLTTTTLPGRRARLAAQRVETWLEDVDVEGLLPEAIADPQVSALTTGAELGAEVVPAARGGWYVHTWGRSGTPRAPREWVLRPFAPLVLSLPEVATTQWLASATLDDGGALLVGLDDADGGPWLLRVRAQAGRDGAASYIPVGAALLPPHGYDPWGLPRVQVSGCWYWTDFLLTEREPDEVAWPLTLAWRDGPWVAEGTTTPGQYAGDALPWAWPAPPDAANAERLAARLAELERLLAPTYALELRYGVLDGADARALDSSALAARLERRVFGTARAGDDLTARGGAHRAYVMDHDVEIGSSAMGPDSILDVAASGLELWCRPTPLAGGRVLVASAVSWQRELGPGRTRTAPGASRLGRRRAGTLELPTAARLDVGDFAVFTPGEWQVVARTSVAGVEGTFVAVLRVTR